MKKITLTSTLLFSTFLTFNTMAAQLNVNGTINLTQDEAFDGNIGAGVAGSGIFANNTTGIINTHGFNLRANGNQSAGIWATGGQIAINGTGNNTLIANGNVGTNAYGINIQSNSGIKSAVTITDMNIQANNNGQSGIQVRGASDYSVGATLNIVGNGTNTFEASGNSSHGVVSFYCADLSISGMETITMNQNGGSGLYAGGPASAPTPVSIIITGSSAANGQITANQNGGAGVNVSEGAYLQITNFNIIANGNSLNGIHSHSFGLLELLGKFGGNNVIIANDNLRSGVAASANSFMAIMDYDLHLSDNQWSGFYSNGPYSVFTLGSTQGRRDVVTVGNGFAIEARDRGVFEISDMNFISDEAVFAKLSGSNYGDGYVATLNMTNSDIALNGSATVFLVDTSNAGGTINNANGNINLDNVRITGVEELLHSVYTNSIINGVATLSANNSILEGKIVTDTGAVSGVSLANSSWSRIGQSNVTNYTSSGSTLFLNTFFGGDGTDTDKLVIEGSSTGDTMLYVNSTGTDETQPEIIVVDQSLVAPSSASAVFSLYGGVVDSGAYEYALDMDELTNNWYLYSTGVATGTAKMISSMPADHLSVIKTGMNQLRKRMGDLRDGSPDKKSGVWVRTYAKNLKVSDYVNSSMNLYGIEAGYDYMLYGDCFHKLYAGIMAGYIYTDNIKHRMNNGRRGKSENKTPSFGVYGTWLHKDGWFADATFRQFFSSMKSNTHDAQDNLIKFDHNRNFSTGSIEAGRQMRIKATPNAQFVIEPKAELQYAYSGSRGFHTNTGNRLEYDTTQSIHTRAATMFGYNQKLDNNMILMPFVEIGIGHEWDGKTDIMYAGSPFKSDLPGTGFDVSLGLNAQLGKGWAAFGDITYENGSVYESFGTNIGVRWNW